MTGRVKSIMVFPVKGVAGVCLQRSRIFKRGLEQDRQWIIYDASGKPMNARANPRIRLVRVEWRDGAFLFTAPDLPPIYDWDDVDAWLSDFFGQPCSLHNVEKKLDERHGGRVSFSHGLPLLLQTRESLDDLNARLAEPITAMQLRPNLLVEGFPAYEEDAWRVVRIGGMVCDMSGLCARCPSATIDPEKGTLSQQNEPLKTLATYRRDPVSGAVNLGVHLTPREEGVMAVGDQVEILE